LDGHLLGRGQRLEEPAQLGQLGEGRGAAPAEDRLDPVREPASLEPELGQHRIDVAPVLALAPNERDEVAIAAARGAERQMDVQVAYAACAHRLSPSRLRTARKASCGTSTEPTCFMR